MSRTRYHPRAILSLTALTAALLGTACSDSTAPSSGVSAAPSPIAGPSFALGVSYTIPSYSSGSGTGTLTSLTTSSTGTRVSGSVKLKSIGGNCVYVEKKGVSRFAVDGVWSRATPNLCSASSGTTYTWSASWGLIYQGIKYHICRVQAFHTDPCGGTVTIYK